MSTQTAKHSLVWYIAIALLIVVAIIVVVMGPMFIGWAIAEALPLGEAATDLVGAVLAVAILVGIIIWATEEPTAADWFKRLGPK